jgi:hypothetical protein
MRREKGWGVKGREREENMGNDRKGEKREGGPKARQRLGKGRKGEEGMGRKERGEEEGGKERKGGGGAVRFMCVVWRKPYKYVSIIKKQLCNRRPEIRAEEGNIRCTLS